MDLALQFPTTEENVDSKVKAAVVLRTAVDWQPLDDAAESWETEHNPLVGVIEVEIQLRLNTVGIFENGENPASGA